VVRRRSGRELCNIVDLVWSIACLGAQRRFSGYWLCIFLGSIPAGVRYQIASYLLNSYPSTSHYSKHRSVVEIMHCVPFVLCRVVLNRLESYLH
jgi:hypothetical protein